MKLMSLRLDSKVFHKKKMLIDKLEQVADCGDIQRQLHLDYIFEFCKRFKKVTHFLGVHSKLKTADLTDLIYTSTSDFLIIALNTLFLYLPVYIPDPATQARFNEKNENSFTLAFSFWTAERRTVVIGLDNQLDIGSSKVVNCPKD